MREFFSPRNKMMPEIPANKSTKINEKVQLESYRSQDLRQNPYMSWTIYRLSNDRMYYFPSYAQSL